MKILIIDDSKIERVVIRSYLQHLNYEIFDAENGETGIQLFIQHNPDIILLGVVMNGIDGYQVAKQLRSQFNNWVPIIFLSGKTKPEDIAIGIQAGGDDYLPKPIQKKVLLAKMTAMERIAAMRNQLLQVTHNLQLANDELAHLAMLDGLTGIANRRYLDISLTKEIARARRYGQPLTLIIADIDFFKKYNDHYGHLQGDECLKAVASALQKTLLRPGELVARYGGEEFCMILPNTHEKNAAIMAEKLLNAVRALEYQHAGIDPHALLSISLGVVNIIPGRNLSAKALMQQADEKLYQAKNNGRNQWLM